MSQRFTAIAFTTRRSAKLCSQLGLLAALLAILGTASCSKKMPDVVGKDQQAATKELEDLKLTVQVTTQKTGKPPGTVIDQDPKAKAKLPDNKTVSLVVEAGGSGTTTTTNQPPVGQP